MQNARKYGQYKGRQHKKPLRLGGRAVYLIIDEKIMRKKVLDRQHSLTDYRIRGAVSWVLW